MENDGYNGKESQVSDKEDQSSHPEHHTSKVDGRHEDGISQFSGNADFHFPVGGALLVKNIKMYHRLPNKQNANDEYHGLDWTRRSHVQDSN